MRKFNMTFKALLGLTAAGTMSLVSADAGTRSYADVATTSYSPSTTHITLRGRVLSNVA